MIDNIYPPICGYGFIADCYSSALISESGSIEWCCMPRFDSASVFGRILDWSNGGYCRVVPSGGYESSRRYIENTLILETTLRTHGGAARLIDFFPMKKGGKHYPHRQILRILEGISGRVDFILKILSRFD